MKQAIDNKTVDIEDIFIWADGSWCYRYERYEMNHKGDDYIVLHFGSEKYNQFFTEVSR